MLICYCILLYEVHNLPTQNRSKLVMLLEVHSQTFQQLHCKFGKLQTLRFEYHKSFLSTSKKKKRKHKNEHKVCQNDSSIMQSFKQPSSAVPLFFSKTLNKKSVELINDIFSLKKDTKSQK